MYFIIYSSKKNNFKQLKKIRIMIKKLTTFSFLALMLIGCVSTENETPKKPEKQTDIHISGWDNNQKVAYWKNGERQFMTTSEKHQERVNSMYVAGNDVYIVGQETQFPPTISEKVKIIAKIWKNGTPSYLPTLTSGYENSSASCVFVAGNDVYVAGAEYNGRNGLAVLWKNGKATSLATNRSAAQSVYVSGSDVYVAGFEDNDKGILVAKLWKNGKVVFHTDGSQNAIFHSVIISGTDIHLSGYEGDVAKTWRNGIPTILNDSNADEEKFKYSSEELFISGTDVYATGTKYAYSTESFGKADVALLWKNGQLQPLEGQEAYARGLYVMDNIVYVVGGIGEEAVLWKNGIASKLPGGRYASSIFITQVEK